MYVYIYIHMSIPNTYNGYNVYVLLNLHTKDVYPMLSQCFLNSLVPLEVSQGQRTHKMIKMCDLLVWNHPLLDEFWGVKNFDPYPIQPYVARKKRPNK